MRNLLKKPWFAAVLAVVAIAFVAQALLPKSEVRRPARPAASVVSEGPDPGGESSGENSGEAPSGAMTAGAIHSAFKELAAIVVTRDPFAPRPRAAVAVIEKIDTSPDMVETLKLSAIWTQAGETYLLINGRICRPGDRIGRFTVESADQEGVWLRHWKGRDFVPMGGAFTLTTPARSAPAGVLTRDG